jgi:carboxyl-terminal processing protease
VNLIRNIVQIALILGLTSLSLLSQTNGERLDGERSIKKVYQTILNRYVAEIDPQKLSNAAIDGMLHELDPYSQHVFKGNSHRLDDITRGEYGGVGIHLGRMNDSLIVVTPMDGTPADRVGIQAGDRIIKIDSVWSRTLSLDDASRAIRGKQGSLVIFLIKRAGEPEPISFSIERELIKVPDISYSGLLKENTGYIKLSNFTKYSGEDLERAVRKLGAVHMKSLILDLRGNPGGLLSAALMSADLFIEADDLLLETRGRVKQSNKKYFARRAPIVPRNLPIAVLVDGGSASASEILSGILQDYDRAVIIGESTFGKGLVQTVTRMTPETRLKLTTAKYYLPSGRLIQKRDIAKNIIYEDLQELEVGDYYSDNNRKFGSGVGVQPDIEVDDYSISNLERELWRNRLFFKYALQYGAAHPGMTLPIKFSDTEVDSFYHWMVEEDQFPKTEFQRWIERGDGLIDSSSSIFPEMEKLQSQLLDLELLQQQLEMQTSKQQILRGLESEVASIIGGNGARVAASLNYDPVVLRTIELLNSQSEVNEILAGKQNQSDR